MADDNDGLRAALDFGEAAFEVVGANGQLVGESMVADEVFVAVDFRLGAASGSGIDSFRCAGNRCLCSLAKTVTACASG